MVTVDSAPERDFARTVHFQLAIDSFPAVRPSCAKFRSGAESTVIGAILLVSNLCFSSEDSYRRREELRIGRCDLSSRVFWRLLIGGF